MVIKIINNLDVGGLKIRSFSRVWGELECQKDV